MRESSGLLGKMPLVHRTLPAIAAACFCTTVGTARADDWTSFGLDATRTRLSAEASGGRFDAGSWEHAWKTNEPLSYRALVATPAIGDGYLAFATQRNLLRVIAEADGHFLWDAQIGGAIVGSPAMWRGLVFAMGVNRQIYAVRLSDGSVAWHRDLGAMGYASPVVAEDSLFVATGSPSPRLFRLDAATGADRWQTGDDDFTTAALASVAIADGHVIASELEGRTVSFAVADGKRQWVSSAAGARIALSSPLVLDGRVYLLSGGATAQLHAVDLATGMAVQGWPVALSIAAPAVDSGVARHRSYVASSPSGGAEGIVVALRADDRLGATATGEAASVRCQEWLFAIDPANRRILWSVESGHRESGDPNQIPNHELVPTPALHRSPSGETLVAVTSSLAARLRVFAMNGDERWSTALAAPTRSSPIFANGRLVVATDAGVVHSFLSGSNQPPLVPDGLSPGSGRASAAAMTTLRWNAAADPEGQPVRYLVRVDDDGEILRDWDLEVMTDAGQLSLGLPALTGGRAYSFALRARDSQGAFSAWSAPQNFVATASPDVSVDDRPVANLPEALATAKAGSTIRVGAGRFDLTATVRLPPGVALSGAGPHLTTLSGKGLAVAVAPGTGSQLGQLTVADAHIGVSVDGATGVHLRNIIVRDDDDAGVDVAPGASVDLVSGTLVRNGIAVRAGGSTTVRNSLVINNGIGLQAAAIGVLSSRYNDVYQNQSDDYRNVARAPTDLAAKVAFDTADSSGGDLRLEAAQPTTDRGDSSDDFSLEPAPNGHRINIGAFGNTAFAELSATAGTQPDPTPDATSAPGTPARNPGGCACATGGRSSETPRSLVALACLAAGWRRWRRRRSG